MTRDSVCLIALLWSLGCTVTAADLDPEPDPTLDPEPTMEEPEPPSAAAGAWGAPEPLHELPGTSQLATLRVDDAGRAIVVWQQSHPTAPVNRMWARRQTATGWEAPVLVTTDGNLASAIELVAGPNTSAAWLQWVSNERRVVTTRLGDDGVWTPPAVLRSSPWQQGSIVGPRLAASSTHAAIVWAYEDPASRLWTLEVRSRATTADWSVAPPIATGIRLAGYAGPLLAISVEDGGAVVAAWGQQEQDRVEVWVRRGIPVDGSLSISWEAPHKLATLPMTPAALPLRQVWTGAHAGRSFAAWMAADADGTISVATGHRRPDGTWYAEQATTGITSRHYAAPELVAAATGHKLVVWREPLAESSRIVARRYDADAGWDAGTVVADGLKAPYLGCLDVDAHYVDVAIDPQGNAIAVWEERLDETVQGRSVMGLWSSHYIAQKGWQPAVRIDAGGTHATAPLIGLAAGTVGVAIYASETADGRASLATNQFAPTAGDPR